MKKVDVAGRSFLVKL